MIRVCLITAALAFQLLFGFSSGEIRGDDRPNILWISCEDISPNLGCYGDPHAVTPHLDRLASEGVRFTRAFTPAGVCAVVRSGMITGMYPPAIGSQHMRSSIVPPPQVKAFPEYLRRAGYYTSNRSKTDFQFASTPNIWDRQGTEHADWRDRDDSDQPFFSVINFTVSHESRIRHSDAEHAKVIDQIGAANAHDPADCRDTIPDYLPPTEATAENWARYLDNITLMDQKVGEVLQRLRDDGLDDNTVVCFWSDHGMGMPRGKRWIYDSGTRVPLIIRWPAQRPAPAGYDRGGVRDDLVSVLDLPPTCLAIARAEVPRYMHGRQLFGADQGDEPSYLFFHRDRMDEVYELQRGARDRRWKYIRNFEPDKPYSQRLDYMDQMPAMKDWRRLAAEGKLTGGQKNWFTTPKPIEELYDTKNDPWELENLAAKPQYHDRLERMRRATQRWQVDIADSGMIPEPVMMAEMKSSLEDRQASPPRITQADQVIALASDTEGASITFRIRESDHWGPWRLYTKSFKSPPSSRIQTQGHRLGIRSSDVVTFKTEPTSKNPN